MTRFSANLGFLWTELELPDAIRAAKRAGFDAVECHWPYAVDPETVSQALADTGLRMLNINTIRGDIGVGEFGTAALPGRERETRAAIDQAIAYSAKIGNPDIHVLPGITNDPNAREVFLRNLEYACGQAADHGITILIEPVSTGDVPGYFLTTTDQAMQLVNMSGANNLRMMFDCYHIFMMEGDVTGRLEAVYPAVRHVQFSSPPGRDWPDRGLLDFEAIFRRLKELGHRRPPGAEYRPGGPTEESLGWLAKYRDADN